MSKIPPGRGPAYDLSPTAQLRALGLSALGLALLTPTVLPAEAPFGGQQVISTTADGARSVFAADVDGDGDVDVLSASVADKIAWYENLGDDDGTGPCAPTVTSACFDDEQVISTAADNTRSIFAADVDGDGDVDVLSASSNDYKIAWYENLGADDGTGPCAPTMTSACFGGQQVISTVAGGASSVFAADVDGDGDVDVLSASATDFKIAWYENLGDDDGTGPCAPTMTSACFGGQQVISTAAEVASSVFAADVDGDGDVDVLSASANDFKIAWYENLGDDDGTGPCAPTMTSACFGGQQVISTAADFAVSVFAADVDGDGDVDVLSASLNDFKIAWYENLGDDDGTGPCAPTMTSACFGSQQVISTAAVNPASVFAADVDGDGDVDVLSASLNDFKIAWYENLGDDDGTGPCAPTMTSACFDSQQVISTAAEGAFSVFAADVDGDGDVDVLSASFYIDEIAWHENLTIHRTADFASETLINDEAESPMAVTAADFDADGDLDLATAQTGGANGGLRLHTNPTGTIWSTTDITATPNAVALAAGDLDRDGDPDLLAAFTSRGGDWIAWHKNDAATPWTGTSVTSSVIDPRAVALADLDGDGDPDAVSASAGDDKIAWYENRLEEVTGDFGPQTVVSTAAIDPTDVTAADIDGDGDLDLVSASEKDDKIAWYDNTGGGAFQTQQLVISSSVAAAQSVTAADIDRDGDTDVLATGSGDDEVLWFENLAGNGSLWTERTISSSTKGAHALWIDDLDGDGDLDVVATSLDDNQVVWFEQIPAAPPTWIEHQVGNVGAASDVLAADLDRDGRLDVATLSNQLGEVSWFENVGGQFQTAGLDTAQGFVSNSQTEDMLAIDLVHAGRAGDTDVELVSLEIELLDAGGAALASAQANSLVDRAFLYADDGDGSFDPTSDTVVSTVQTFNLGLEGTQTFAVADDQPTARVPFGASGRFFVVFEMAANAEGQPLSEFKLRHRSDVETADDADHDLALTLDEGDSTTTGIVSTALTSAPAGSCQSPFDLNLQNRTIDTSLVCEAGTVLRTGAALVIATPGDLTLRAGQAVESGIGLEVGAGGSLQIEIDPGL